ncbi:MAG: hypothetical protein K5981_09360 [Clostridia bacterium]|nr:hypothetical protein [Clostridia bacterium]
MVEGEEATLRSKMREHEKEWWHDLGTWRVDVINKTLRKEEAQILEKLMISTCDPKQLYNKEIPGLTPLEKRLQIKPRWISFTEDGQPVYHCRSIREVCTYGIAGLRMDVIPWAKGVTEDEVESLTIPLNNMALVTKGQAGEVKSYEDIGRYICPLDRFWLAMRSVVFGKSEEKQKVTGQKAARQLLYETPDIDLSVRISTGTNDAASSITMLGKDELQLYCWVCRDVQSGVLVAMNRADVERLIG